MGPSNPSYAEFPVLETIEIREVSDIPEAVQKMTETYAVKSHEREFSYRLLLPRGDKLNMKARRIGMTAQSEFLLSLRLKKLKPNLREIRYVHDVDHYGWLFVDPTFHDRYFAASP